MHFLLLISIKIKQPFPIPCPSNCQCYGFLACLPRACAVWTNRYMDSEHHRWVWPDALQQPHAFAMDVVTGEEARALESDGKREDCCSTVLGMLSCHTKSIVSTVPAGKGLTREPACVFPSLRSPTFRVSLLREQHLSSVSPGAGTQCISQCVSQTQRKMWEGLSRA